MSAHAGRAPLAHKAFRSTATWTVHAWEGVEENWEGWGTPMWWSHHDSETNLRMLQEAGFRLESAEGHTSEGETWLWVIARK